MNLDLTHLIWTSILSIIISHLGANYLKDNTPKGYWFWFTIISLLTSVIFI